MAKTLTSRLVMEVIDRVTGPARAMSKSILGIGDAVRGANGARGGFADRLTGAIDRNNMALDAARGRMVDAIAGAYMLRGAIAAPVGSAMRLEESMADIAKVTDLTDAQLATLRDSLVSMSREIPLTVEELASITAAAGQAGIATDELATFTADAARAASAFDVPADVMGQRIAEMRTALGLNQAEAMLLVDAMNALSNQTAASASDLLDFTSRTAAFGKMAGFTAEQTTALGAAMISAGAAPDVAATSFMNLSRALTRGTSATGRQKAAYEKLGFTAEEVAARMQIDAVGTTEAVLAALSRIPKEQQAAIASDLFGDEARGLGPLLTNLDLYRSAMGMVADQTDYAGSAMKEFEKRSKTTSAQMQRFKSRIAAVSIAIGTALLPVLSDLMDFMGPIVDRIGAWIEANRGLAAGLAVATAGLVAFRVAAATLSYVGLLGRGGLLSALAFGFGTVGRAASGVYRAAAGTIALQGALAAMDGAKVGLLAKISAGLRGIAAVTGLTAVSGAISAVVAAVAAISAPVWLAIAAAVAAVGVAWRYWDRIASFISGVGSALADILSPAIEAARPYLEFLAPIGEAIGKGWELAKSAISAVGDLLGSLFTREVLTEDEKAAAEQAGRDFIYAIWNGMKSVASAVGTWISDTVNGWVKTVTDAVNGLASSLSAAGVGSVGNSPAGAPNRADVIKGQKAKGGAISRGNTYLVGEEGPELITASRSGYVNPTGSGSGGAAPTINQSFSFQVNGGTDPEGAARKIMRIIQEETRAALRGIQGDVGLSTY